MRTVLLMALALSACTTGRTIHIATAPTPAPTIATPPTLPTLRCAGYPNCGQARPLPLPQIHKPRRPRP